MLVLSNMKHRTREEIEEATSKQIDGATSVEEIVAIVIELLLDIRDLLEPEINGVPGVIDPGFGIAQVVGKEPFNLEELMEEYADTTKDYEDNIKNDRQASARVDKLRKLEIISIIKSKLK